MSVRRRVDVAERRARIGVRHRLARSRHTDDVVAIANDLVALHSSDPVTVYLSVAARMAEPSLRAVDVALYEYRSLVRHHAMRRTLWVMTPAVARIAHASCTAGIAAVERRRLLQLLETDGVADDVEAWLDDARTQTLAALHLHGPSTARQLGAAVPALKAPLQLARGKSYGATVQAHTRVLLLLGFEGEIVRAHPTGSWINSQYRWTSMQDWLGAPLDGVDRMTAAAQLAARWLRAFGPGHVSDLQWWTGWTVATTKQALVACGAVEVEVDEGVGWMAADDLDEVAPPEPWVALLPGLDPTTMGWKRRDWYLDPAAMPALFDRNGNGGPAVWADGKVIGGWVQRKDGRIAVKLFVDGGREQRTAIEAAAHDLEALVGDTRFTVRFPAPMQAELLA
jgi:hypothetical protein